MVPQGLLHLVLLSPAETPAESKRKSEHSLGPAFLVVNVRSLGAQMAGCLVPAPPTPPWHTWVKSEYRGAVVRGKSLDRSRHCPVLEARESSGQLGPMAGADELSKQEETGVWKAVLCLGPSRSGPTRLSRPGTATGLLPASAPQHQARVVLLWPGFLGQVSSTGRGYRVPACQSLCL